MFLAILAGSEEISEIFQAYIRLCTFEFEYDIQTVEVMSYGNVLMIIYNDTLRKEDLRIHVKLSFPRSPQSVKTQS